MTDYIKREDVLQLCREGKLLSSNAFQKLAIGYITDIPSADVQPSKWISVYDQLPDYNMVVLVTDGEDVGTGYRYALGETGFMGWAIPFADIEEDDVSHWMPLPEPLKDSEL